MLIENPTLDQIINQIKSLAPGKNDAVLILLAQDASIDVLNLIEQLNSMGVKFFGGLFPRVIHDVKQYNQACILLKIPVINRPIMVLGLKEFDPNLSHLTTIINNLEKKATAITLIDGFSTNISAFLRALQNITGTSTNLIGGGAGTLDIHQQACVFSNDGFYQDAAVICFVDYDLNMSMHHGMKKKIGPFIATRTQKNVIYELNWESAFNVYEGVLNEYGVEKLTFDNFFFFAKGFPFGILREEDEDIARVPITFTKEGALICIGEVPENTVLNILVADNDSFIEAAENSLKAVIQEENSNCDFLFIVDCVSRSLFMGDQFEKELTLIQEELKEKINIKEIFGVMSVGEIASNGEDFVEFQNKSIIIGAFQKN
ncbi:MAG: FIST N-terminal domain-containing protein [Bacteroidota bacterium]